MKLIIGCCFFFLLLSVLIPEKTEAVDKKLLKEVATLALKQGYKLTKMLFYAKCMMNKPPPGVKCPKFALGVGLSANLATASAKLLLKAPCKGLIGACSTFQYTKQK